MSTSKNLTAGLAAAALVSAIGLAYAQSTDSTTTPAQPTQPAPSDTTSGTPAATSPSTPAQTQDSTMQGQSGTTDSATTEPAPQADRN